MAWWLNLEEGAAPVVESNDGTRTAQQILGIPDGYGNWVTGDVRPNLSGANRDLAALLAVWERDPVGAYTGYPGYYFQEREV